MNSAIYKIESRLFPERCYIGSAMRVKFRWNNHLSILRNNKHHSPKLQNHFNKYGESDLVFIIIEPCFPQFLIIREQFYIDSLKPYFNVCPKAGSVLGLKQSEETKKKRSASMKGRMPWNAGKVGVYSDERIMEMSKRASNPSASTRQKLREAKLRNPNSPETNLKISKALTGKHLSEEHKKNVGLARKGMKLGPQKPEDIKKRVESRLKNAKPGWNKGKKGIYTQETLQKMRDSAKKRGISKELMEKMIAGRWKLKKAS